MREYAQTFYEGAHERRIAHNGHRVLNAHVNALSAKTNRDGHWVFEKLAYTDGGMAAIMAVGRADRVPAKRGKLRVYG